MLSLPRGIWILVLVSLVNCLPYRVLLSTNPEQQRMLPYPMKSPLPIVPLVQPNASPLLLSKVPMQIPMQRGPMPVFGPNNPIASIPQMRMPSTQLAATPPFPALPIPARVTGQNMFPPQAFGFNPQSAIGQPNFYPGGIGIAAPALSGGPSLASIFGEDSDEDENTIEDGEEILTDDDDGIGNLGEGDENVDAVGDEGSDEGVEGSDSEGDDEDDDGNDENIDEEGDSEGDDEDDDGNDENIDEEGDFEGDDEDDDGNDEGDEDIDEEGNEEELNFEGDEDIDEEGDEENEEDDADSSKGDDDDADKENDSNSKDSKTSERDENEEADEDTDEESDKDEEQGGVEEEGDSDEVEGQRITDYDFGIPGIREFAQHIRGFL